MRRITIVHNGLTLFKIPGERQGVTAYLVLQEIPEEPPPFPYSEFFQRVPQQTHKKETSLDKIRKIGEVKSKLIDAAKGNPALAARLKMQGLM